MLSKLFDVTKFITGMIFASVYSILIPEFKMAYFLTIIKNFSKLLLATVPTNLGLRHRLRLSGRLDATVADWESSDCYVCLFCCSIPLDVCVFTVTICIKMRPGMWHRWKHGAGNFRQQQCDLLPLRQPYIYTGKLCCFELKSAATGHITPYNKEKLHCHVSPTDKCFTSLIYMYSTALIIHNCFSLPWKHNELKLALSALYDVYNN